MRVVINSNPVRLAGEHISQIFSQAALTDRPVLFLSSGGSSLEITEYLALPDFLDLTVGVVDERVAVGDGNNFEALSQTDFFHRVVAGGGGFIDTKLNPEEGGQALADRFEDHLRDWFDSKTDPEVIVTMGIGADGHTAGVFPLEPELFDQVYRTDRWAVNLDVGSMSDFPDRVVTTEGFLLQKPTKTVSLVTGAGKRGALEKTLASVGSVEETPARLVKKMAEPIIFTSIEL